ncbi:MAG TPA: hypothetical protein VFT80_05610 [Actinomycetota bacterium]|nr:hypothetical protein [Actinomycetota bacterium]
MSNARYRVRLRDTEGYRQIVTVWAEGEAEAIERTKLWFELQHDLGQVWAEERIGPDPDPGDLDVAESSAEVNHRSFSPDGEVLSTKFRVEPEHLRRSTHLMRKSGRPSWQRLRARLQTRGIDPSDAVVADSSVHEPDPQNPVRLVVRGLGRTIVVYSTTHEALDSMNSTRDGSGTATIACRRPRRSWRASGRAGCPELVHQLDRPRTHQDRRPTASRPTGDGTPPAREV